MFSKTVAQHCHYLRRFVGSYFHYHLVCMSALYPIPASRFLCILLALLQALKFTVTEVLMGLLPLTHRELQFEHVSSK